MIVALEEAKRKLVALYDVVGELKNQLRIDEAKERCAELERETLVQDFWSDAEKSSKKLQEIKQLKDKYESYEALAAKLDDTFTLCEMAIEAEDEDSVEEVVSETEAIENEAESKRIEVLLSGPYDKNNAIVSFHPGAGGTEAQDWASMLYRLYTRWGEKHGFNVKLVDWLDGDAAGIKSATIMVEGLNAYGYLKSENGVHRLVRISPFDASGRRQTSFASVEVMPDIEDDIEININPDDLRIDTYRASGAGSQHVNKTSSAIRITHIPTGVVVACQNERSQFQNKDTAMKMLKAKLMELAEAEQKEKIEDIKGVQKEIAWGSQIRSYVFHPYNMVKDHRTNYEVGNIGSVMDGNLDGFINDYLRKASLGQLTLK